MWIKNMDFNSHLQHCLPRADLYVFGYQIAVANLWRLASRHSTGADRPCHLGESPTGRGRRWSNEARHRSTVPKEGADSFGVTRRLRDLRVQTHFFSPAPPVARRAKNWTWANPKPPLLLGPTSNLLLIPHLLQSLEVFSSDVDASPALDGHRKFLPQLNFLPLSARVSAFPVHSEHLWHRLPPICSYGYPMRRRTAALFFIASFVLTSSCRIFHCEEK